LAAAVLGPAVLDGGVACRRPVIRRRSCVNAASKGASGEAMPSYALYMDADWVRLEQDWTAWWHGALERPLLVLTTNHFDSDVDANAIDIWDQLTQFPPEAPVSRLLEQGQLWLETTHYYADAYPNWSPNFGPGIVAGFLGARVEHGDHTTWFHPLGATTLEGVTVTYDPANVWWRQVQAVTRAAVQRWGSQVTVGFTDLGGNLDILASLRGTQDLLLDLHDAPEEIDRLLPQITDAWLRYYNALAAVIGPAGRGFTCWGPCWFPRPGFFLQSDFSYMISPKAFERYVMPDLARCCTALEYPFYHLDGKGALKHLDLLCDLPGLRGIQWVPGDGQPPADQWPEVLRRIRAAGKLCQVFADRQGAWTIAKELGGRGFLLYIVEDLTDQEAEDFVHAFWREFLPGQPVPGERHRMHGW
jgi:5-methyltetrahydrofolate--homocysteine methyltransferase